MADKQPHSKSHITLSLICLRPVFSPFLPPPLGPIAGLLPEPLLDAGAQRLLVVQPVESLQHAALMGLVLVPARVDLWDQSVEVWVSAQRTPRDELLPAGRTLFVPEEGADVFNMTRVLSFCTVSSTEYVDFNYTAIKVWLKNVAYVLKHFHDFLLC